MTSCLKINLPRYFKNPLRTTSLWTIFDMIINTKNKKGYVILRTHITEGETNSCKLSPNVHTHTGAWKKAQNTCAHGPEIDVERKWGEGRKERGEEGRKWKKGRGKTGRVGKIRREEGGGGGKKEGSVCVGWERKGGFRVAWLVECRLLAWEVKGFVFYKSSLPNKALNSRNFLSIILTFWSLHMIKFLFTERAWWHSHNLKHWLVTLTLVTLPLHWSF